MAEMYWMDALWLIGPVGDDGDVGPDVGPDVADDVTRVVAALTVAALEVGPGVPVASNGFPVTMDTPAAPYCPPESTMSAEMKSTPATANVMLVDTVYGTFFKLALFSSVLSGLK